MQLNQPQNKHSHILCNIFIGFVVAIITWVVVTTILFDDIPQKAMEYVDEVEEDRTISIEWMYPTEYNCGKPDTFTMTISYEDYKQSYLSPVYRYDSNICTYADLVNPNDPYVKKIAEHINDLMVGQSEYLRATAGMWFISEAIAYRLDNYLYGLEEFASLPVETLFVGKGDCEDTSILLCSIYRAMGIDSGLLKYDGHISVYAVIDGILYRCESTSIYGYPDTNLSKIGEYTFCTESNKLYRAVCSFTCTIRYYTYAYLGI